LNASVVTFPGKIFAREVYAKDEAAELGLVDEEPLQESTGLIRSPGEV
jgi:hypothetical protein